MAILGITLNKTNPAFSIEDFSFWMPQYSNYLNTTEGQNGFRKIKGIVNKKIFKSIYGSDWEYAMSLAIAHYFTLIGQQSATPGGDTLASIAGGGATKGVLSSATIGGFSKTYDLDKSLIVSDEATFWNQTSYGAQLMTLLKTKAIPSIMVVTNNPIPGAGSFELPDENEY